MFAKTLIINNVGFIDLIPIPLPFYSKLRTKWSTDKKFEIDGKPLPLLLLELAFEENFSKIKRFEFSRQVSMFN